MDKTKKQDEMSKTVNFVKECIRKSNISKDGIPMIESPIFIEAVKMAQIETREEFFKKAKIEIEKAINERCNTGSYQDPLYILKKWIDDNR